MKKLFSLTLAALTAFCFVACDKKEENKSANVSSNIVTYTSFEENEGNMKHWSQGIQLIRVLENFGKISLNTDAKYVKTGTQSLCIRPAGGYYDYSIPYIILPLYSETYGLDLRNFSDVEKVTMEFYNAEETDVKVAVGLIPTITDINTRTRSSYVWQTLKSGWNSISCEIDLAMMSMLYDMESVAGLYIAFENHASLAHDLVNAPEIYLDDVRIVHGDTVIPDYMDVPMGDMEVCDFEENWNQYVFNDLGTPGSNPSIVKAADYLNKSTNEPMTTMNGSASMMRFTRVKVDDPSNTLCGLSVTPDAMKKSFFKTLTAEDLSSVCIAFDIFNNNPYTVNLELRYWPGSSSRYTGGVYLAPYTWMTYKVNLLSIYQIDNNFVKVGGTQMTLCWTDGACTSETEEEFFLDNLRFEWSK